MKIQSRIQE
jgi:hypothetical protein